MDAQLVFQPTNSEVLISFVQKKGETASVGGPLFAPSQDQRYLATAVGDEALHARQIPTTVLTQSRLQLHVLQIRAGLGFGEGHGSGHLSGSEAGQIGRLDLIRGELVDGLANVLQTKNIHERGIRPRDQLDDHSGNRHRQKEAAVATRQRHAHEIGLPQALERLGQRRRVADISIHQLTAQPVHLLRARRHELGSYAPRELQHPVVAIARIGQVAGSVGKLARLFVAVLP